jgi:hypothetical protein
MNHEIHRDGGDDHSNWQTFKQSSFDQLKSGGWETNSFVVKDGERI